MPRCFRILPIMLFAVTLCAADAKTEVAKLVEALERASLAQDADAYAKLLTSDFHAITRTGVVRDRQATAAFIKNGTAPPDLKREDVATVVYGDTVITLTRQTWTAHDGARRKVILQQVFVRQNGTWKQAAQSASDIASQEK